MHHTNTTEKKRLRNHNTFLPIMARKCGLCREAGHDRRKCPNKERGAEIELMDAEELRSPSACGANTTTK